MIKELLIQEKNGKDIIELIVFNGYIEKSKKITQYLHFRCGMTHKNYSKKIK